MDDRVVLLLEEIAFRISHGSLEKKDYLEQLYKGTIYASGVGSAVPVHAKLQAQPKAQREVPVRKGDKRVHAEPPKRITGTQAKEKDDKLKNLCIRINNVAKM